MSLLNATLESKIEEISSSIYLTEQGKIRLQKSIEIIAKNKKVCMKKGHKGRIYIKAEGDYYNGIPPNPEDNVYECVRCKEIYYIQYPSLFQENQVMVQLPF